MISAHQLTSVKSLILANPWVNDSMHAVVSSRHYYRRLGEAHFWKKLITFQYNISEYFFAFFAHAKKRIADLLSPGNEAFETLNEPAVRFQGRMLSGFQNFNGPVLFLKSGLSLISEEFDHLVNSSKSWHKAYSRVGVKRLELPSADQTFSTAAARREMCEAVGGWMNELNTLPATDK
jgi:uncharacterized protein